MDGRSADWWLSGIFLDYPIDFEIPPTPSSPRLHSRHFPSNYGVASVDRASPFNSVGITEVDPPLLAIWPGTTSTPSGVPSLPPTTPGFTDTPLSPSPPVTLSSQILLPSPAPHSPGRITKRRRKHTCPYPGCGYSCALPKDLRKHTSTHYPPSIECPNRPNGCDRLFRREDHCARHAATSCQHRSSTLNG